jgi:hypothetical protein
MLWALTVARLGVMQIDNEDDVGQPAVHRGFGTDLEQCTVSPALSLHSYVSDAKRCAASAED